jgi:KUP system potassium uptake protein
MINSEAHILYIPFLALSIMASIIASQAMISGMFSVVYQGITTKIMPMFRVDYTSTEFRTQIYIGTVNWFLLIFVLTAMFVFKESSNLASAYGLAVTGTMTITGIMMTWIFFLRKNINRMCIAGLITLIDIVFLTSNMFKIPHGGYWSLIIASLPLAIILIYTNGQKRLYQALKPIPIKKFLEEYIPAYNEFYRIRGTALYLTRDAKNIPPYITNTMFCNKIIYQNNILISASILDEAFGVKTIFTGTITEGLQVLEIQIGYMEVIDMETILREAGIEENVIFYGLEDIFTDNPIWKIFAFIKKITPSFVQFYSLPSNKLHGIITRVEI